ncbi:hypothetical protein AGABI2DRAFT_177205 [Agaricus bisporus var. bisporus H97]|uniref:hypothetical protein n=1 Tax=Agaricus bisporus var. bisporus (strain H97 / ATCC MYA-4626 / FGSC 10389) TaxID=936046 RepID=UPI00029F5BC6|nr:hypothetical protein AGABI2DRAFT_177205 [Agaricus bisporus var. bisporus H97]EKV49053.1 hypothetical protein AGABI2DRAFT_177205 [Agaricus bisporus var. bisporus H97]
MQGFNKYYPPDYDPSQGSLNKVRGEASTAILHCKHALGDRARKLDQGILITRFELPFNIWCDGCNNHIGMGVRYNAEKKKIGNYYSTPIFSFRCKCHLCDNWFEIQTDPKNTRYVVTSGARQKDEEWDPEENGGFAIHDPDKKGIPDDPLAALEKTSEAQTNLTKVQIPRLEALQSVSEHYNSDPYALSVKARNKFRQEKKVEQLKRKADDDIKGRYGLPVSLSLLEDDEKAKEEAKQAWEEARQEFQSQESSKKRRIAGLEVPSTSSSRTGVATLGSGSASSRPHKSNSKPRSSLDTLRARIMENTAKNSTVSTQPRISKTVLPIRKS